MHAKGLEFDVVFFTRLGGRIVSTSKIFGRKGRCTALEEERRLAYVGITRAKKQAYISFSMNRFYHGDWIEKFSFTFY